MEDPLMEVRTSLTTTTNVTGGLGSATWGAVEIQKKVDQLISDTIMREVDLTPLVKRKPMGQLTYFWNVRTDLGSTNKSAFYGDGAGGTPYPSTKKQLYAVAKSIRSDYEVTGLMMAGSSSYYSALADEAATAIDELKLNQEKAMICGTDTGAYGLANSYMGLLQLMRWYDTNGGDVEGTAANEMQDTGTIFGTARANGTATQFLDCSYVLAGTIGTSTGVLELKHLDKSITRANKKGGKDHEKVFFCSEERVDEINQLLQPQQRFAGTLNLEGGFTISTYKNIPIVGSRYMDKNGATNTTSWDSSTDADNSMYLLDLNEIEFRVLDGVDSKHITVMGDNTSAYNRADMQGGYFKTYGVFVMKTFNSQVHIANLTSPA